MRSSTIFRQTINQILFTQGGNRCVTSIDGKLVDFKKYGASSNCKTDDQGHGVGDKLARTNFVYTRYAMNRKNLQEHLMCSRSENVTNLFSNFCPLLIVTFSKRYNSVNTVLSVMLIPRQVACLKVVYMLSGTRDRPRRPSPRVTLAKPAVFFYFFEKLNQPFT